MSPGARFARLALCLVAAYVLYIAFGSLLDFRGVRPNIALVAMLVSAIFMDANGGAALGFVMGLLEASYLPFYKGSTVVTRTLAGFLVGILEVRIFRDSPFVAIAVVFLGTLFVDLCFMLFAPQPNLGQWSLHALYEAIYNALFALPAYFLLRAVVTPRRRYRL